MLIHGYHSNYIGSFAHYGDVLNQRRILKDQEMRRPRPSRLEILTLALWGLFGCLEVQGFRAPFPVIRLNTTQASQKQTCFKEMCEEAKICSNPHQT